MVAKHCQQFRHLEWPNIEVDEFVAAFIEFAQKQRVVTEALASYLARIFGDCQQRMDQRDLARR
jgi:hypothetical protein